MNGEQPELSLDDLYAMTARMYSQRNEERPAMATLAHFIEVCAALSGPARAKHRVALDTTDALCKSLAWFFPLMAKLRVRSVEALVWRKFPYVCPYCLACPHDNDNCKASGAPAPDPADLRRLGIEHEGMRPRTLEEWRSMFAAIYPRTIEDVKEGRSILGLFEELGELAEAVRVFDSYPAYVAGEVADTVSYIMALATEHGLSIADGSTFDFDLAYLHRYPGVCLSCGYEVCVCPPLPVASVGRLSKELQVLPDEDLFVAGAGPLDLNLRGAHAAELAAPFRLVAMYDLTERRKSLVIRLLDAADELLEASPGAAASVRSAAFRVMSEGRRA